MTNLKAGSGSTVKPVQGPQICLILGDFWWSSNRRFEDPEPSLKGLRSAERSVFFLLRAPNWLFTRGQMWSPNRLSSIYIYIYLFIFFVATDLLGAYTGPFNWPLVLSYRKPVPLVRRSSETLVLRWFSRVFDSCQFASFPGVSFWQSRPSAKIIGKLARSPKRITLKTETEEFAWGLFLANSAFNYYGRTAQEPNCNRNRRNRFQEP